ncbi:hypothetical protein NPIL_152801 [Nephila pilipes]|uniref:Uncharacterized protein n=1 Tax=Nephila pilipes TaxID=299642 RepID=A0A8X6MPQ1_NEPPI|nr:hypothetical protein NPIL_152801 [Nephila pilipes]
MIRENIRIIQGYFRKASENIYRRDVCRQKEGIVPSVASETGLDFDVGENSWRYLSCLLQMDNPNRRPFHEMSEIDSQENLEEKSNSGIVSETSTTEHCKNVSELEFRAKVVQNSVISVCHSF